MKTILVYTGVLRLHPHYTNDNACHMTIHEGTTTSMTLLFTL